MNENTTEEKGAPAGRPRFGLVAVGVALLAALAGVGGCWMGTRNGAEGTPRPTTTTTNVETAALPVAGAVGSTGNGAEGTPRPTMTELGGVQLWEGGPYWAECNVGASQPEEAGYYFWWGDTVGYMRNADDDGWISVKDSTSFEFSAETCPTCGKSDSELRSMGYIDATGNLVSAHDAATAHLGAPWRMPTDAEFAALVKNCTTTWTTRNGVNGRLVTGKGAYASRSIFLPAAGNGYDSDLYGLGSYGYYWSSTPHSGNSFYAWFLYFSSGDFLRDDYNRYYGRSVRPVRGFAE